MGLSKRLLAIGMSLMVVFFGIRSTHAATVTSLTDQPSSLVVSVASNHKFSFTTTATIAEGDTVTLTFPSAFDTSTVTEDDVDLAVGGTDATTDAVCGAAQFSAIMAADVLTFTRCAGAGTVGIGSAIEIEIGANASASGSGSNRIVNPANEATYLVNLGGTSTNVGSIPLPIGLRSGSGVSVDMTGGGGAVTGGGGGGPPPRSTTCGDGVCESPETETSCHADCAPTPVPDAPVCGDGVCESPETELSCSADCEVVIVPPPPEPEPEPLPEPEPQPTPTPVTPTEPGETDSGEQPPVAVTVDLFATPNLPLGEINGSIDVLSGTSTIVNVTVESAQTPSAVLLVIGDSQYVLSPNADGTFSGVVDAPAGDDVMSAIAVFADGSQTSENVATHVIGGGRVYELVEGREVMVGNAIVTAYAVSAERDVAFDARAYGESNPIVTSSGYFSWYVPNGTYTVYAAKTGYTEGQATVHVSNNILVADIQMKRLPAVIEPPVEPTRPSLVTSTSQFLDSPEAELVADIALPLSAIVAAIGLSSLALGFNLLAYLQYLFTAPVLILGRKKRNAFGIVYNAITKIPIELAIVRVYRVADGRLVKSAVTNPKGEYWVMVPPGEYRIEAIKSGFVFPSAYLAGVKIDGQYLDVYSGQTIVVTENEVKIAANIPLDPSDVAKFHAPRTLAFKRLVRVLQLVFGVSGLALSMVVYVIHPSIAAGVMIAIQIIVFLLVWRLAKPKRPKGWGIVYDEVTHRPVGNAIIRVFEPKYNKLIETALSDGLGRYSFLLGPNEYFVSYSKPGYTEKVVRPIDYTKKSEPTPLALKIGLQHATEEMHAQV